MHKAEHLVGNPGAIHAEGVAAMRVLKESREKIALHLGVKAREIIFTSGLTESDNLAILGYARALERVRRTLVDTRWIVSAIEHDSVLESFGEIERLGGTVVHISPDERGLFSPEQISRELTEDTVFVSIGWANNEIGVMQPLSKIVRVIRAYEKEHGTTTAVHTDAGQAPLYVPTVLHSLDVDLVSMSAAKLYGPHGVGLLYVNPRISIAKITFGGHQERSLRAGTENVALAVKEMHFLPRETIEARFNLKGDEGMVIEAAGTISSGMTGMGFLYANKESISIGIGCLVSDFQRTGETPYDLLDRFKKHPSIAPLIDAYSRMLGSARLLRGVRRRIEETLLSAESAAGAWPEESVSMMDAIAHLLRPLRIFGVSSQRISFCVAYVIRLVPLLLEHWQQYAEAWRARAGKRPGLRMIAPFFASIYRCLVIL